MIDRIRTLIAVSGLRSTGYLALLCLLISASGIRADDADEMLRFNGQAGFDRMLAKPPGQSASDQVIYESPASAEAHQLFDRVLFNGLAADTGFVLQVSCESGGSWGGWQDVYTKFFPNGRFWSRFDLVRTNGRRIRFRLIDKNTAGEFRLQIFAVQVLEGKKSISPLESSRSDQSPPLFFMVDTIRQPDLVTREEWGANPPIGDYVPHSPYRLTQHHTAGARIATLAQGIAEMQFIQDFHQNGRGWQDIGYHYCVDDAGRVYEGVPPDFRGTHTGGNNTGNVGISYMGNFDLSGENPTEVTLDTLVQMWSWLSFEYTINPDSLFGHRDYSLTACPGGNFYPDLPDLRNGMRHLLGFGAPYAADPLPQPFSREVDPETIVGVFVRDDEEGVDGSTIVMTINGELVDATVKGSGSEFVVFYQTDEPYPASQNVIVNVSASDLADPPNVMNYSYQFQIEIAALHAEVLDATSMLNAELQISGEWETDFEDVNLDDLFNSQRLLAIDEDASHLARIYPEVAEPGDYRILIASNDNLLGESARYIFVDEDGQVQPHFAEYNNTFYLDWGQLAPTPVHFDDDGDESGYIELSGNGDFPIRLMIDAIRFEKVDRLDPPTAPTLKWVKRTGAGSNKVEIAWYPSLEGDIAGYRIFQSDDGLTWADAFIDENSLGAATESYIHLLSGELSEQYFRVVAVDTNTVVDESGEEVPLLSAPTDVYGAGTASEANILIVDNFDRRASWSLSHHPFAASYGKAVTANGHGFDTCTETAVQHGEIDLDSYEVVIYFCGDDSRSDESIAAADQYRLLDYLEGGGKLFISGSEIGYDFDATTSEELERYEYLFRSLYIGDLAGSNRVLGENGTPFEGLDFEYGTQTGPDQYIEDFPDYIQPAQGSGVALFYSNLRIAGIQFTGSYGEGNPPAQLVYLGFTYETIISPFQRTLVMRGVLDYFSLPTSIDDEVHLPGEFALYQNYPNPFNPVTNFKFRISDFGSVDLKVYDVQGRLVRTILDEKMAPGSYTARWDGGNDRSEPVASGVYIYRLSAGEFQQSRKMVLLR